MNENTLHRRCRGSALATVVLAACWSGSVAFGASTGSSGLYMPQGSSASVDNGDYVTSSVTATQNGVTTTPRNTYYRYFIEVPSGLSRLRIQLFDADVGAGGTTEASAGRDRARNTTFNTTATYSLLDPSGTARLTQFTTGDMTSPAGADNAWLTFYDGNGNNVQDNFGTVSYSNNDGNHNWAGSWTESGDSATTPITTTGGIQVNTNQLRIGQVTGTPSIARQADLSASGLNLQTAWFSFTFTGSGNAADTIAVEVSNDGGTSYTTLETLNGGDATTSRDYNITSFIAANTRVRFRVTGGLPSNRTRFFFFDNVRIHDGGTLTNGHWELRVAQSAGGDDLNAIGIRADDGDETSGGTEIPIYFDAMNQFGVNPPASGSDSRSYNAYPYITSGCTAKEQDFDYDSDQAGAGSVGSIAFTSRTGATTQTVASASLSENNQWKQNTINSWTTDANSQDYGIWSMVLAIGTYVNTNGINGNYTTFYVADSGAASITPTNSATYPTFDASHNLANAFRVYLPTDNGSTPVKPYVEQFVRFRFGPNPPVVGQTQTDTVTVRVTNPTAHAITFSSTNLVTANVPGSGVVYGGNPQKTQGTVVSAPAVNGTGNITWNPGTVAAGAVVLLSYDIKVTPTSPGQHLPAVGTVASGNGTKAVWLDETGNATQARATFTFGPLCEVAINQGMLTAAVVASMEGIPADGGMMLEWRTASEAGTIGFDLYRQGSDGTWSKVNRGLLLGLLSAPQGGTYRFLDGAASPREAQTYLLVEIDAKGNRRNLGPFQVRADWNRATAGRGTAYERTAHAPVRRESGDDAGLLQKDLRAQAASLASGPVDALRVAVRESGLYYLTSASLAPWFGVPIATMEKLLGDGKLALSKGGQPVAWYPDLGGKQGKEGKGLFFYGEALSSLYSRDNIYRLERGTGLRMNVAGAGGAAGTSPASFAATLHAEQNLLPATVLPLNPESDYWFWDGLLAGDPTNGSKSFTLDAPGAVGAGGTGTLTVHLQGASSSGMTGEHHPAVSLNGTALGETHFQGISAADATFSFAPSLLLPTGNQVRVTGLLDSGIPYSLFYINSFDLTYPRSLRAAGGALAFTGAAGPVQVAGFGDPAVRLLDLSTPAQPRWIAGATVAANPQGGWNLTFQAPSPTSTSYLASATAGLKTPIALAPFRAQRLRSTSNHADVVILAGAGLHDAAQRLADYRAGQGLDSMVVDLDEVTDEFAYGLPDPHAIPAFLAYARTAWQTAPRYLVLAGAGTVDYRNLLGYGDNLLPPLFVSTDDGLFPSDSRMGDLVGDDGLPELAVGRIPAHSAAELNAYIDKVAAYESGADGGWVGSAIALADAPDRGADFAAGSEQVASFLASYNVDRIYLGSSTLEDARSRLFHDLGAGASLVNYMGHGGLDRLASGGLLASSDVASLGNGPRLPLFTAMTCAVNRFAVPGFPSLGELLVDQAGGGAAAVWAPSGLSIHFEADLLAARFYRHLGDPDGARLGDLILRALQDFQGLGGSKGMLQIYNLLGDPALRLRRPTPGPGGSSGSVRE